MHTDSWTLSKDEDEFARMARVLGAGVNAEILRELVRARRKGDGWMYLSEIANAIQEAPGSVAHGLGQMTMLVEERREKGLRYFRATFTDVRLELEAVRERKAALPPAPRPRP